MKNHTHKHEHCRHERLKFCLNCNMPHCLDCGEEWNKERIVYQYYPVYQQPVYTQPFYQAPLPNVCPTITCEGNSTSGFVVTSNDLYIGQCSH